jgi:hypothetical protein
VRRAGCYGRPDREVGVVMSLTNVRGDRRLIFPDSPRRTHERITRNALHHMVGGAEGVVVADGGVPRRVCVDIAVTGRRLAGAPLPRPRMGCTCAESGGHGPTEQQQPGGGQFCYTVHRATTTTSPQKLWHFKSLSLQVRAVKRILAAHAVEDGYRTQPG